MSKNRDPYVCPAELAGSLDNWLRRLIHKPERILRPFLGEGMSALDLGCGPGYFTIEMARLVGAGGTVIAADLQQGMLDRMMAKITSAGLSERVKAQLCQSETIGVIQRVDFILAFWMVHEVRDQERLFEELKYILKPGAKLLVVEPKIHVAGKAFRKMAGRLKSAGLEIIEWPQVAISRSLVAVKPK